MNSFKNLKIGKKLILSFLTILILTSSLSIYILGKLSYTANLTDYMYDGPYKLVNEFFRDSYGNYQYIKMFK